MINPRNALLAYLYQQQMQQQPMNMLAAADDGFDPNGPIAQMLRAQRAVEAAKAAQAQKTQPRARPMPQTPYGVEPAQSTLMRRMREQGLNQ